MATTDCPVCATQCITIWELGGCDLCDWIQYSIAWSALGLCFFFFMAANGDMCI